MLLVNAVTLACLILIILEIAASVAAIAFSGRGDRISFIRSFKKGKFAIIYATAFPLYYVAHTYVGEGILEAFFSTVNEIKGLVTLEYETDGIKLLIVSNNTAERVTPFAEMLGLRFVPNGAKPLPKGFKRAIAELGISKKQVCAVGDQIFTDILGANMAGIRSIFVYPIEFEHSTFFKVKRAIEKPLLPKRYDKF